MTLDAFSSLQKAYITSEINKILEIEKELGI